MLDLSVSQSSRQFGLFRAAQALALTEERSYCIPDDIKRLVLFVCPPYSGELAVCFGVKKK